MNCVNSCYEPYPVFGCPDKGTCTFRGNMSSLMKHYKNKRHYKMKQQAHCKV